MADAWLEQRARILHRAGGRCEYCRSPAKFATQAFSVEHIVPRVRGGADADSNLALACQGCNNHKYAKTTAKDPISHESVALFHPREFAWDEHFVWNHDATQIIGITPTGRATVESL